MDPSNEKFESKKSLDFGHPGSLDPYPWIRAWLIGVYTFVTIPGAITACFSGFEHKFKPKLANIWKCKHFVIFSR